MAAVLRDAAFLVSLNYTSTSYDAFLFERGRSPDANATRAAHFAENLRMIREHNARYAAGLERWYMGLNEFADWSPAERRRLRKLRKLPLRRLLGHAAGSWRSSQGRQP